MLVAHKKLRTSYLIGARPQRYAALLLTFGLHSICLHAQTKSAAQAASVAEMSPHAGLNTSTSLPEAPHAAASGEKIHHSNSMGFSVFDPAKSGVSASFPDLRQRERHFLSDLLGPTAFIAPAVKSGIDTARTLKNAYPSDGFIAVGKHPAHGDVPEWGEGAQGYAKRYADRFGQGLIGTTSRYALGELLREDVTYHRCACTGLLPRTGHAVAGAYLAHTHSGRAIPSLPALASPFIASEIAVSSWYPARYNTSDALRVSLLNYVAAPFKNLFAEFSGK